MWTIDPEKRREAERIRKLRNWVAQVGTADLWSRTTPPGEGQEEGSDSLQEAIQRRARSLGVTPRELLRDYARQLSESTYPTPSCLKPEDVQRIAASRELNAEQATHVKSCTACQQLLAASQQSPAELDELMALVGEAALKADQTQQEAEATAASAARPAAR